MFHSDVYSLLDVSVTDFLVDDDADGGLGYVVDDTSLSVVNLEWHTLLYGTVGSDINDITNPEFLLDPNHIPRIRSCSLVREEVS